MFELYLVARFNFHQVYLNANDRYPQEFNRVVSEYRTYYWDAVHNSDISTTQGRQALATLYNTATQAWGDVSIHALKDPLMPRSKSLSLLLK